MKHKILVTGGAGFIGSNFLHHILARHPETEVVNFDKLTYAGNPKNVKDLETDPRYTFFRGDICDLDAVGKAMADADTVIHFAAETHVDNSIASSFVFTHTNVFGTHVVLEAARARRIKKFLHISTDEVYGSIAHGSYKEDAPQNPTSPYAASKVSAEFMVRAWHHTFGIPTVTVRLSNTFGPRQHPEKLIPLFITNLLQNKKVPLMGDGMHVRSWIYVADACRALDFVFERGEAGEVYNIPGTYELENREVTKILLTLLKKDESYIEQVPNRLGHDRRYSVDGTKLFKLGWKPEYNRAQAFQETVAWYLAQ